MLYLNSQQLFIKCSCESSMIHEQNIRLHTHDTYRSFILPKRHQNNNVIIYSYSYPKIVPLIKQVITLIQLKLARNQTRENITQIISKNNKINLYQNNDLGERVQSYKYIFYIRLYRIFGGHVEIINYGKNIIECSFKSERIYHTQN